MFRGGIADTTKRCGPSVPRVSAAIEPRGLQDVELRACVILDG